jgi:hypothetical protein
MKEDVPNKLNRNGSPTLGAGPKGSFPGDQPLSHSFLEFKGAQHE